MEVLFAGMLQEILSFCYKIEDVSEVMTGIGLQIVSLEQVQVELFEKQICGGSRTSIYQIFYGSFPSQQHR
ncbi:unnamed protein product [Linum tenue]|uniref:Uncharacterized protein n=1 Tax=Linum tenue TaxID=586396 RepID=A0AAV0IRU5_9ROSI|nr:unnamed protein product [Linum tenue]